MSGARNVHVSVTIAGSATTLIILMIVWCVCAAPYNAMREATLDAIEAEAYVMWEAGIPYKERAALGDLFAKRRRAEIAYERLPFFVKWFADHPHKYLDNSSVPVASRMPIAEE